MIVWILLSESGEVIAVFRHKPSRKEKKKACVDYLLAFLRVDTPEEFKRVNGLDLNKEIKKLGRLTIKESILL